MPRSARLSASPSAAAERPLSAVIAVGSALATTSDHEQLLANVIDAVCRTLGVAAGGFMRYDPATDELVLQSPAFGVHAEDVVGEYRVRVSAGGGNAARVFLSREPYFTNDAARNPRMIQRFIRLFGARNTITVPLVLGERPVGVFHCINKHDGDFNAEDQALLSVLAPLLASCLQSAQNFKAIELERRKLERTMLVHSELTRSVMRGEGIGPLCVTLQRLLGRPVLVLDALRRPLASAAWDGLKPATLAAIGAMLPDGMGLRRLSVVDGRRQRRELACVSIRLEHEIAGYMLVGEQGTALDSIDVKALEQAALVFAVEILKERSAFEAERRRTGDLLAELMREDTKPARSRALLDALGYTGAGPWRVVRIGALRAADVHEGSEHGEASAQWRRALTDTLRERGIVAPVLPWANGYITLLENDAAERLREPALLRQIERSLAHALRDTPRPRLAIGVGRSDATPAGLAASLRGAEHALRAALGTASAARVAFIEELGVYRVLLGGNRTEDHAEFVEQVLGSLLEADRRRCDGRLLETLRGLVAQDFNLASTARALGVHVNTVKYRQRRIGELLQGDPARGARRLELALALKIVELHGLAPADGNRDRKA
ncbi:MAG TPA: GAF domain-containing protein [Gammaproteobacteria bacterium]|nr:GAF domain-containing protein [Gammaproteobacteria bacterium]